MTTSRKYMNRAVGVLVATALCLTVVPGFTTEARANKGAAFLGGMVAGHVVTSAVNRDKRRTQAVEYQAYSQPQSASSSSGGGSAEARIQQLDKLAAGGYITPAEYKAKKQAILDSL